jgi:transporter family-2 protein|tara:strand:- start:343 stop:786 length:444 start_codon:yes stop_codon:yes gene_type:complete
MSYILTTLAFIVGGLLPIQVGVNAELARYINSPILAALISFLVGGTCLIFGAVILKTPLPSLNQVASLPTWLWGGGMIGAAVVLGSILAGPKIGALALVSLLLAGQLVVSILIDHYGWLGFPIQKMNIQRLLGVLLLVGGFLLVRKT